ncbi:DUF3060 domain-containing protein [Nocardiopsis sp. HNM0947]|uniref:DUF3060 domain-containing protein n=1 Tax=Nocardiopsis coralli TaxID=2772213 RepID=A0ABR9P0C2_9ACTN|nr:DUF3060 domain-containing protein [Nocardiopsis coralli]MBE2997270.1 DUF3060 domain-containing protein [Nocardiopsis coralli]
MRVGPLATVGGAVLLALLMAGCEAGPSASDGGDGGSADQGGGDVPRHEPDQAEGNVVQDDVLVIVDDGSQVHGRCADREVVVTADDAEVVLDGPCGLVRATGRGSNVEVGSAEKIVLVGVDNTVSYTSGEPEVINRGRDTTVNQGGSAAA